MMLQVNAIKVRKSNLAEPDGRVGRHGADWSAVVAQASDGNQYTLATATSAGADRKQLEQTAGSLARWVSKNRADQNWLVRVVAAGDDRLALIARMRHQYSTSEIAERRLTHEARLAKRAATRASKAA